MEMNYKDVNTYWNSDNNDFDFAVNFISTNFTLFVLELKDHSKTLKFSDSKRLEIYLEKSLMRNRVRIKFPFSNLILFVSSDLVILTYCLLFMYHCTCLKIVSCICVFGVCK